jgi:hypothetical protein
MLFDRVKFDEDKPRLCIRNDRTRILRKYANVSKITFFVWAVWRVLSEREMHTSLSRCDPLLREARK